MGSNILYLKDPDLNGSYPKPNQIVDCDGLVLPKNMAYNTMSLLYPDDDDVFLFPLISLDTPIHTHKYIGN